MRAAVQLRQCAREDEDEDEDKDEGGGGTTTTTTHSRLTSDLLDRSRSRWREDQLLLSPATTHTLTVQFTVREDHSSLWRVFKRTPKGHLQ